MGATLMSTPCAYRRRCGQLILFHPDEESRLRSTGASFHCPHCGGSQSFHVGPDPRDQKVKAAEKALKLMTRSRDYWHRKAKEYEWAWARATWNLAPPGVHTMHEDGFGSATWVAPCGAHGTKPISQWSATQGLRQHVKRCGCAPTSIIEVTA